MSARSEGKTTDKTTGALVKQPHGGALRNGGTNRGGPGRPPSKLRAICRKMAGSRIHILGKISKDPDAKDADKIRAIDVLLKHGLDRSVSIADIRECLRQQSELAYEVLPREMADEFLAQARDIWASL